MKTRLNKLIVFLFCSHVVFAQINTAFIEHLSITGLKKEHRAYLNSLPKQNDSVYYFEAKFYTNYFNDSLFLINYIKSQNLCVPDSALNAKASKFFLLDDRKVFRDAWFSKVSSFTTTTSGNYFQIVYKASLNPNLYSKELFPIELRKSYLSYKQIYNKKPLLGASLSIIVPGLGKLYGAKPKSALLTFLLNAGYASQTIESAKKLGVKNALTIIDATAFAVFYLANVYGSYADILSLRKERKKQFLTDAANFYN